MVRSEDTPQSRASQTGHSRSPVTASGPTPQTSETTKVARFSGSPSVSMENARPAKAARREPEEPPQCQDCSSQEGLKELEALTQRLIAAQRRFPASSSQDRRRLLALRDASQALAGACDATLHEAATQDSWLILLPTDIAIRLFSCCDAASLASLSCVCHALNGQNCSSSILGEAATMSAR